MATGSKIIKIDIIIEIDQYFFSFEPGLVSTSGPGPGQRCNGYLKVHKRNRYEEQNIVYKVSVIVIKGVQQMIKAGEEEKSKHQSLRRGPQKTEEEDICHQWVGSCLPSIFYKCFLNNLNYSWSRNPGLRKHILH